MKITESQLKHIIKESVKKIVAENNSQAVLCAIEDLEQTINNFENVQAMAYNFGMEREANQIMSKLLMFKQEIEAMSQD